MDILYVRLTTQHGKDKNGPDINYNMNVVIKLLKTFQTSLRLNIFCFSLTLNLPLSPGSQMPD